MHEIKDFLERKACLFHCRQLTEKVGSDVEPHGDQHAARHGNPIPPYNPATCASIAYLSGVPANERAMTARESQDWVDVARYSNAAAATVAAGLLIGLNIPHRIQHYRRTFEWYIWVPAEFEGDAREALKPGQISEAELTEQALKEPPPDDA
jgi:hypothetical protein